MALTFLMAGTSCSGSIASEGTAADATFEERGAFSADSAYGYVERQVEFGPRVPGTAAHGQCREWLSEQLRIFGADTVAVLTSQAELRGEPVAVNNIYARIKGKKPISAGNGPILLVAHYDTRPWADQDASPAARMTPIDGANDGASGVGVIMELARNLAADRPDVTVDILFTDLEDSGDSGDNDNTWCIGASQFARNMPYTKDEMPRFGILLDMVGGRGAVFPQEYFSSVSAPSATAKVWDMARRLDLGRRFPMRMGGAITDDHLPLIKAGIPTTDIIESANSTTGSFSPTWHTLDDNMKNIDRSTLGDVGRVIINVIYNEK